MTDESATMTCLIPNLVTAFLYNPLIFSKNFITKFHGFYEMGRVMQTKRLVNGAQDGTRTHMPKAHAPQTCVSTIPPPERL